MDFDHGWDALLNPGRSSRYFELADPSGIRVHGPGWDVSHAWCLAEASRLVYRHSGRSGHLQRVGLREEMFLSVESTQCAVWRGTRGPGCLMIVFRGTNDLRNWLTNFDVVLADWDGHGRVHRGFLRALHKVWGELERCLDSFEEDVYYTGHSLGGALAMLAASLRPPVATYAFGAPRVGDEAFASTLAENVYRVVNGRDIVPTLPPSLKAHGFMHGGELFRIGDPGGGAEDHPVQDLVDTRRWFDPHPVLSDHAPVNYVAQLTRML